MDSKEQAKDLTLLGAKKTSYAFDGPSADILETFLNAHPDRHYVVEFTGNEFSSLCPRTGQPDWAEFGIRIVPGKLCIESKSLKLYLGSYRNHGAFMEKITNDILDHLVKVCNPRGIVVEMVFNARGGIGTNVAAVYVDPSLNEDTAFSIADILGVAI